MDWVFLADRRGASANAAGQLFEAIAAIGVVVLSKILLGRLVHANQHHALTVLGPLFGVALVSSLVSLGSTVSAQRERLIAERVQQSIWRRLLDVVGSVDLVVYESDGFATRLARVEQNAVARPLPMVRAVFALMGAGMTAAAMTVVLFTFGPWLPPVLLLSAIPTVVLGRMAGRSEFQFAAAVTPLYMRREYLRGVLSKRQHAAEVRAFGAARMLRPRYGDLDATLLKQLASQVKRRTWLAVGTAAAAAMALFLALGVIVGLVEADLLTLAQAGSAAIASRLLAGSLSRAYTAYGTISEATPHILDLNNFLTETRGEEVVGHRRPLRRRLELAGVGFTYPSNSNPVLRDIDLVIEAGQVVALVGENGSGKSTLARIIAGLYAPSTGSVCWDTAPSRSADRSESIGLLTQDFGRYALSVADNIAIGDSALSATTDSLSHAADAAQFTPVLAKLPYGYQTTLGRDLDEGVDLSGGEWQRLALARVLFRGADLMVLDEPSAALDPRAESDLFDDVRKVLSGRSALLISHRYASARLADKIYVLHEGRIVESGSHDQLMADDGRYAELFRVQSAAFMEGLRGGMDDR